MSGRDSASAPPLGAGDAGPARRPPVLQLLDLVSDAVYVTDPVTGRIEYANPAASAMLGYTSEQLTAMTVSDLLAPESSTHPPGIPRASPERSRVRRRAAGGGVVACDSRRRTVDMDGAERLVIVDTAARATAPDEGQQGRLVTVVTDITTAALSDAVVDDVHRRLVDSAAELLDADGVMLVALDPASGRYTSLAATGEAMLFFHEHPERINQEALSDWMATKEMIVSPEPLPETDPEGARLVGPMIAARLPGAQPARGTLAAVRNPGRPVFTAAEQRLMFDLTRRVATIMELIEARAARQRLELLEDRERIARDLHDTVIQDLIGMGMQLANSATATTDWVMSETLPDWIEQIDDIVRKLRSVVFATRQSWQRGGAVSAVRASVAEAARALGHWPVVTMDGPVDDLPAPVVAHLLPSLREALSNVARHASANRTRVTITVDGSRLTLVVDDDGRGPGEGGGAGTGLANLRRRAEEVGGSVTLARGESGGARLVWTARIAPAGD